MKILVTGSRGFIGSNLVRALSSNQNQIFEFDKLINNEMDVTLTDSVNKFVTDSKPDVILHLAANANPRIASDDPKIDLNINTVGTLNILKAVQQLPNKPYFIFISSAYVYGDNVRSPVSETQNPNPCSPYGIGKLAAEYYIRFFSKKYSVPFTILRLFNIIGPGQGTGYVVPDLISRISRIDQTSHKLALRGRLEDTRDFLYIDDLIHLFEKLIVSQPRNQVFNVATGVPSKIGDLAIIIAETMGRRDLKIVPEIQDERKPSVFYADPRRIYNTLGWSPQIPLKEAIRKIIEQLSFPQPAIQKTSKS